MCRLQEAEYFLYADKAQDILLNKFLLYIRCHITFINNTQISLLFRYGCIYIELKWFLFKSLQFLFDVENSFVN